MFRNLNVRVATVAISAFVLAGLSFADGAKAIAEKTISAAGDKAAKIEKMDIVKTAMHCKEHTIFAKLVNAAGLTETLSDPKAQFTVFAPTDEAFKKLGQETLDNLMKPENKEKLQNILKHHVITGIIKAEQVSTLKTTKPLAGPELIITNTPDHKVLINNATITQTDIECTNGIIHVVDTVLTTE